MSKVLNHKFWLKGEVIYKKNDLNEPYAESHFTLGGMLSLSIQHTYTQIQKKSNQTCFRHLINTITLIPSSFTFWYLNIS